jgi:hypothetical protein
MNVANSPLATSGATIAVQVMTLATARCSRPCSLSGTERDISPCATGPSSPRPSSAVTPCIIQPGARESEQEHADCGHHDGALEGVELAEPTYDRPHQSALGDSEEQADDRQRQSNVSDTPVEAMRRVRHPYALQALLSELRDDEHRDDRGHALVAPHGLQRADRGWSAANRSRGDSRAAATRT